LRLRQLRDQVDHDGPLVSRSASSARPALAGTRSFAPPASSR
jgi:hypothetical protein